ncbi:MULTISPECIES: IclR family transcriptional regulator [unclassified Arthrobacter]|uniref:IclR family transcriptional regulator n=1 Tax=unclassified Arthrobacter TaxID=235627 RepID=UPI0006F8884A|nr:IclR family transcriptional regulator [Arthrobacter sp. Leaf234]KQN98765.1 transcriptional regulator [Arthrobacter sp. Leaf234]
MAESSTRTVERALVLLGAVCEAGSITLADAARGTGLSASTALRLLRTLESTGFVRRDGDGSYRPGLRVVQLGAQALGQESLVSLAEPALERLVGQTGESAYLSVPSHDGQGVYLAMREGTHSVRHASWVGRSIPLDGTAVGAVLAGAAGPDGFVVVRDGVEADVTAVAAPVSPGGRVVAAISVVVPSYRITATEARRLGALVAREAEDLLAHIPAGPLGHDLTGEPA